MNFDLLVKVYEMFRGIFDAAIHMLKNIFGADEEEDTTVAE